MCIRDSGDFVWFDYDHDGIQDTDENGVEGVEVELWQCGATARLAVTLTDPTGHFLFDGLAAGDFYVKYILPAGYMFTEADAGASYQLDSNADRVSGATPCITLAHGQSDMTWDAGIYPIWRTGDTATGLGTRITVKKSSTWFMYNTIDDPDFASDPGAEPVLVATFALQGGNPKDGENVIGTLYVYRTAAKTYKVCYTLLESVERNGSLWQIIDCCDSHLSIKDDSPNYTAVPGRDDNADFCRAFKVKDGVFYFFAHVVVCYE